MVDHSHGAMRNVLSGFALTFFFLFAAADGSQAAEDFYKGKQITIICSGAGVYEAYARAVAKHMPRHIPGNPTIIVQMMQGASGLTAANHLYNQAPKDGTVIAATHGHIPTSPLLTPDGTRFDPNQFSWIGSATKDLYVAYVSRTSPAQSMEEAKTKEITVGGQAVGSMSIDMAILARELFGLKLKIVTGYTGSPETMLAMEKGEVNGHFGNFWSNLKQTHPDWIKNKDVKVISQFGFKRHHELPDVPLFVDLAQNDADRQLLELMLARQETARPYYGPPGMPADRLGVLRDAFDKTMKDPEFLGELNRAQLDPDEPMGWQEMTALVAKLQKTPPSVAQRLTGIFDKFRTGGG
jgi:tripartite-type tricarboxylate transporter receptor subunit TctC